MFLVTPPVLPAGWGDVKSEGGRPKVKTKLEAERVALSIPASHSLTFGDALLKAR